MADVELSTLGSVIKTAYEGQSNTNAFTDSYAASVAQLSLTSSIIAISANAVTNSKTGSIVIGDGAEVNGLPNASAGELPEDMIAIGAGSSAINRASIAIGSGATAGSTYTGSPAIHDMAAIAIGYDATASSRFSVVIGRLANDQGALNATVIGDQAGSSKGTGQKCVIIGNDGGAGERGVAIGDTVDAGAYGIVIGSGLATSNGTQYGQAYGDGATCSHNYSIALGKGATTTATSQLMIGGTTGSDVLDVVINGDLTVNGTSNVTANISVEDEGTEIVAADTINFVGSGVVVTDVGGVATVTIGGGGSTAWGDITGTLSNQTDLQSALDGKLSTSGEAATVATINGRISQGTNVTITGLGTSASPYVINSSASVSDGDKGDITVSASGATWTIDDESVTLAKIQHISTDSFLGRDTAGTGDVEVLSATTVRSILNVEDGADVTDSTNVLSALSGQALAVATINTGNGAVECYAMDQAVTTSSDVVFNSVVAPVAINAQTGTTYTLVLGDAGKHLDVENASAITLTVPPNSSVAFATGTQISIAQMGAGQVTLAQGAGVTIRTPETLKLRKQYSACVITKIGTDEWLLTGDLEESA